MFVSSLRTLFVFALLRFRLVSGDFERVFQFQLSFELLKGDSSEILRLVYLRLVSILFLEQLSGVFREEGDS